MVISKLPCGYWELNPVHLSTPSEPYFLRQGMLPPACPNRAVPTAHITYVIDCATGKQVSLDVLSVPPQVSRPTQGHLIPPMKTFIFCGENTPRGTQDSSLSCRPLAGTKDTLPSYRGLVDPASLPDSPPCPRDDPKAERSSLKAGATQRTSNKGLFKRSFKALSSCVCVQAE
ncbi:Srarp [Phodopus roborovskii]|uniref:Srarp protein n=1 Tax=Phodopus roborovskii TaxID=109678 RepID=A0AAV0AA80_PHORO|nr:Srarp [Phodopus roborovskii]